MDARVHAQATKYSSPWPLATRLRILAWYAAWPILCGWTPKPMNAWRLFWLRRFGATILGRPFVHPRARIANPWSLTMHHRASLGDGAVAYCLDRIVLHAGCTVAQEAYLCTGTHDFESERTELVTAPIVVGEDAFIGLRAVLLPGVSVGPRAVVGAASVVTRPVAAGAVVAGNPARALPRRHPPKE